MKFRDLGIYIEQEEDAAGFLGVNLERDEETSLLEMKQPGLINHVTNYVELDAGMYKRNYTPTGSIPLVNNEDGVPGSGIFNYSRVVGILIYLSSHTSPDIAFVVNCCAVYMFCPKH